jgi:hypothetical protein
MSGLRFLNDVAKPWDELNRLLSERLALQPDLSDVTRLAGTLAVAIRHQVDVAGIKDALANSECIEHRLITDTADFWKHGALRQPERNNRLSTEAFFEYAPDKGFSFIRNALFVEHASLGKHDFMTTSLGAIKYWIKKRGIATAWSGSVHENPQEFHPTVFLRFDPARCISMDQVRLGFFSRQPDGSWVRVAPPEVRFEVY